MEIMCERKKCICLTFEITITLFEYVIIFSVIFHQHTDSISIFLAIRNDFRVMLSLNYLIIYYTEIVPKYGKSQSYKEYGKSVQAVPQNCRKRKFINSHTLNSQNIYQKKRHCSYSKRYSHRTES